MIMLFILIKFIRMSTNLVRLITRENCESFSHVFQSDILIRRKVSSGKNMFTMVACIIVFCVLTRNVHLSYRAIQYQC